MASILLAQLCVYAQPANDVCNTATEIIYNGNTGCVTGTLKNANDDLQGLPPSTQCPNPNRGNEVWYFFEANNQNTQIRLLAPDFTQAHINLFDGDCTNRLLVTCGESNTGEITINVGTTIGQVYYITVSDGNLNQGNFTLCVESNNTPNTPGNICSEAVNVCSKNEINIEDTEGLTSSNTIPACFQQGGVSIAARLDSWFKFTVTKSGNLEFAVFPRENLQEIDFAVYDITDGCPGNLLSCNYNYSTGLGITSPTGMWSDTSVFANSREFNKPIPVVANRTYAILIDNYYGRPEGFDIFWGGTFDISTTANFTADKIFDCEAFTANFTDQSIGATNLLWTFPDGSTSISQTPSYNFTVPGENVVTLDVSNNRNPCKSSFSSRFIVNNLKLNNTIPDSTICVGENIQFTNTVDSIILNTPAQFAFNSNGNFSNNNPLNAVGLIQNVFPATYATTDLQEVCLSLRHSNLSEIEVNLVSPSGTRLQLISAGDLSGQNIENVCFRDDAANSINTVASPYSGTFKSKNSFDAFIGSNKQGIWTLELRDAVNNKNIGFFSNWSLSFSNKNNTEVLWSPSTYLSDPGTLNPLLQSPSALLETENIFYNIVLSDQTGCKDNANSDITINIKSFAGRDTSIYFCDDISQINLFDILSSDATQNGQWFDANYNSVSNFFNPSNFLGQTIKRFYKITGSAAKCGADSAEFTLIVRPDTSINYTLPDKICEGQAATIMLNSSLNGFVQFFTSYPSRDSSIIVNGFPNSFVINSGQLPFSIDSIRFDNNKCTLPVSKIINPPTFDQPTLVLDSTVCNSTSTAYTAYLSIIGGETSSLEVNGQNASSRKIVSTPIASGTSFLFECYDANACTIDSLILDIRCDCKSRAGTINNALVNSICDNDTLIINHNGDQFEDPNDVSEYIITTSAFPNFGSIITRDFYNGSIPLFLASPYQIGQVYYLTFITGNNNGNQRVDLQDDCTDFSKSIEFKFSEAPRGNIFLGVNSVCKNAPAPVNFNINSGQPNFTFYRNGNAIFTSTTFNGSFTTSFNQDTVFYVDSVLSANGCMGYNFPKDSSRINVVDFPVFSNINFDCDNIAENYTLTFDVVGGDPPSFNVTGNINLTQNGRSYSSDLLPTGSMFNISVNDKNMCQTTVLDSSFTCNCISVAPEINALPNNGFTCENNTIDLILRDDDNDGTPNFLTLDGNDVQSILILNNINDTALTPIPFVLHTNRLNYSANEFALDQSYFAVVVVGNNDGNGLVNLIDPCIAFSNLIQFRTVSTPTIITTGMDSLCLGNTMAFNVNNSSKFDVDFTLQNAASTENYNLNALQGPTNLSFTPNNVARNSYFVNNIIDNSPANCPGIWLGDSVIATVLQSPQLQFLNGTDSICIGEKFTVNYSVNSDAPCNFDLFYKGIFLQNITASNGNNTFSFSPNESGILEARNLVSAFDGGFCSGNALNTLAIGIFEPAMFSVSISPTIPCVGDIITLDFTSNKNDFSLDIFSDKNESYTSSTNSVSFNYKTKSTTDSIRFIQLVGSDKSSQSGNTCIYNLDSTIYINSKPLPTLNITPLFTNPVCENDYAVFEFTCTGNADFTVNTNIDGATRQINSASTNFLDSILVGSKDISFEVKNITDAFCTSTINQSFNITSTPAVIADINLSSTEVCEPAEVALLNNTAGLINCEWTLNGIVKSIDCNGFNETVNASQNLFYNFSYTDANGCNNSVKSNALEILVSPIAEFTITPEFPNINNPIVQTTNLSSNFNLSEWTLNGDLTSTENDPIIELPAVVDVENTLQLTVFNSNGCFDTASVKIYVEPNLTVYIPNAFTPDGDGTNDCFEVISSGASNKGFNLSIYNRWGELIFESSQKNACWDGTFNNKAVPSGLYAFKLRIFTSTLNRFEDYFGKVYVIR